MFTRDDTIRTGTGAPIFSVSNIFERWESDDDLEAFRSLPGDGVETPPILAAEVRRYRISSVEHT